MQQIVSFPSGQVKYLFNSTLPALWQHYDPKDVVIITDEHLEAIYPHLLGDIRTIVLPPGEPAKSFRTIESIIGRLLKLEATRSTVLVAIGGGVITDITGFAAACYMRGVATAFVPTTLLAMVDAAIGGKNGINAGVFKNVAGTITQPGCLLFDTSLLASLPADEWSNGFAEIIKYACIFDAALFDELSQNSIAHYRNNDEALQKLVQTCVNWKNHTVIADEKETGQRKLLNFGHTAAHAIENLHGLAHGQAVAIGMVIAATLSEQLGYTFPGTVALLKQVLQRYGLPVTYRYDAKQACALLKNDKKRKDDHIDFILLHGIGQAQIHPIPFHIIENTLTLCAQQ